MLCQLPASNDVCDQKLIAQRWASSEPYSENATLDGSFYIYNCTDIAAIDKFLATECSQDMTVTQIDYTRLLISFNDGSIVRDDISALDRLFVGMIETGQDCTTFQGGLSGCV